MLVVRHGSPTTLLERAGEFLRGDEAENNLILGVCSTFRCEPADDVSQLWWLTIEHDGAVVGAAIIARRRFLVITQLPNAATEHLVEFLFEARASILDVSGPSPSITDFADRWSQKVGQRSSLHMDQRIFFL